jgi:hypothetical protein
MFSSNTTQTSGGYEIQRSLRFNSADSAYLNRTPASAGNRKTWTWSAWVKRGSLGSSQYLFSGYTAQSDAGFLGIRFEQNDNSFQITGFDNTWRNTTQAFRDVSAWYHIVVVLDTTQATADNRVRLYINGVEVTSFTLKNNPSQNADLGVNGNWSHNISAVTVSSPDQFFSGYMTEVNFIDGQALTPSSFGEYNADTGVWQPKRYAGSYGTNGFYLNFSNNSNTTAATLGADYSGNGNNWTPNNFSVTAGAGNDSLVDVPTNWGVDTGVGGSVRGNYATLNPLTNTTGRYTVSNGNLQIVATNAFNAYVAATVSLPETGKYYFEYACTNTSGSSRRDSVGFVKNGLAQTYLGNSNTLGYDGFTGEVNGVATGSYATWDNGDIVGVAVDCDTGKVWVAKNNTWQNSGSPTGGTGQVATLTGITDWIPAFGAYSGSEFNYTVNGFTNFGQRPFAYTAPSGFKALNTQNLPTPTIGATPATQAGKFFNPVLYTGNGGTQSVTGVGFQPDWTWLKVRSTSGNSFITDAVRGAGVSIYSNLTDAESNNSALFTSFASDGFNLAGGNATVNGSGSTFVAWNWKANGAGVTNTAGSITSTVSANTTSGFSVVTYTGAGGNQTIGHGIGTAPKMVIVKQRDTSRAWPVYHGALAATQFLTLNTTDAVQTAATFWNSTAPTSTVFSVGTDGALNASGGTYVAYCFAEVPGYSKFGSYVGNGSTDGVFVFTGFRPAYVIYKGSSTSGGAWDIHDTARSPRNVAVQTLFANTSGAEGGIEIDILSNGFKVRDTSANVNSNGVTYIFAAFAEAPQKFALAR